MPSYQLTSLPVAKTQMLIRKPIEQVFEAFTNPIVTTKFWFTKSSGPVKPNTELVWEWEMYDISTRVKVESFELNKYVRFTWNLDNKPSIVEWQFFSQSNGTTFVIITNKDYKGSTDDMVSEAIGSMGGFTFVLAGAKAWLEHDLQLNLTGDHHPAGVQADE